MQVQDIMRAHSVTATVDACLPELVQVLRRQGFRDIPILERGALVGIVSDSDIKQSMASVELVTAGPERGRDAGDRISRMMTLRAPDGARERVLRVATTCRAACGHP